MRKVVFIALIALFCLASPVWAATRYVDGNLPSDCTSGNYSIANRNCSGSDGDAWNTISEGVSNLSNGDTLNIRAGTYADVEGIEIGNYGSMTTIQAYGSETVTIDNSSSARVGPVFKDGSNITIKNLRFEGRRYDPTSDYSWTNYGSNLWYWDTLYWRIEKKDGLVWNAGTFRSSVSDLINNGTDGDYYWDDAAVGGSEGRLYVKSTSGDP